jgi:hypothetical protein
MLKFIANTILDRTGSPAYLWLLCLMYVYFLVNNVSAASLNGKTPLQVLTGSTNDISPLLFFRWYKLVYTTRWMTPIFLPIHVRNVVAGSISLSTLAMPRL